VKQKLPKERPQPVAEGVLKGWTAIARYLGIPVATAHRWASEGMPVRREGRSAVADRAAVSAWLGRESHMPKPAHVMTQDADVAAALKESIAAARKRKEQSAFSTQQSALSQNSPEKNT
jgi:phage terminase Nu1 subunit (DNA packaging protein)